MILLLSKNKLRFQEVRINCPRPYRYHVVALHKVPLRVKWVIPVEFLGPHLTPTECLFGPAIDSSSCVFSRFSFLFGGVHLPVSSKERICGNRIFWFLDSLNMCLPSYLFYGLVRFVEVWIERFFLPVLLHGHLASRVVEMSEVIPVLFSVTWFCFSLEVCSLSLGSESPLGYAWCWLPALTVLGLAGPCGLETTVPLVGCSCISLPPVFLLFFSLSLLNSYETGVRSHQLILWAAYPFYPIFCLVFKYCALGDSLTFYSRCSLGFFIP